MAINSVVISSINSDSGSSSTDFVTNDATISVTGTATRTTTGNPDTLNVFATIGTTHVYLGSVTLTVGTAQQWSIPVSTNLLSTNGAYTIQAYSANSANTTWPGGTAAATHAMTFDNVAPTFGVNVVTVAANDIVDANGEQNPIQIAGTVTGANGGTVLIEILDGATVMGSVTVAVGAGGAFSGSITGLSFPAAGSYSVRTTATDVAGNVSAVHAETFTSTVCFLAGTMIKTPAGETAIDKLAIGDLVTTLDGSAKPVKFIGRQTISLIFADKLKSQPILIRAGALDENVPSRDLYTSPGHAMLLDGNLVIASALVNGRSVVRWEQCPGVFTYYHVELEGHEVIFANDAATETYCDNVPREVFDNAVEYKALYPNAKPIKQLDLPTVKSQRQLPAATKKRLAARAAALAGSASNVA